jgi:hypothetical protein
MSNKPSQELVGEVGIWDNLDDLPYGTKIYVHPQSDEVERDVEGTTMTHDEIIELAVEAGLISAFNAAPYRPDVERFAALVAAAERKRVQQELGALKAQLAQEPVTYVQGTSPSGTPTHFGPEITDMPLYAAPLTPEVERDAAVMKALRDWSSGALSNNQFCDAIDAAMQKGGGDE